jgi:hypothetical protein
VIGVDADVDPDLRIDAFSGPIHFCGLDDALIPVRARGSSRDLSGRFVPAGGSFAIRAHYAGSKPRGGRFGAVVRSRLDP